MRIWILGAGGLLGKSVKNLCQKRQLDCLSSSSDQVDIRDPKALQSFAERHRPSHILNCAAYADVDGAEQNPALAFSVNSEGPTFLAKVAKKAGIKLVHVSTDYVFEGSSAVPYKEEDACRPINVYGKSKRKGEENILEMDSQVCIVRTSWLFGRGGKSFVSNLLNWLREKETFSVVSDQRGSPTYCKDLAEALLKLMNEQGIFHFANRGSPSRFEIAQEVLTEGRLASLPFKCQNILPVSHQKFVQTAPRPIYTALNVDKTESILGYPIRGWKEVVKDFVNEEIQ